MKMFNSTLASFVVMTALATPALAMQEPQPQQPQTPQIQPAPQADMRSDVAEPKTATGQLVRVDNDAMTIVIKGADDQEQSFRYTDNTKVVGAQEQISGLSTKTGSLVTVHFTQGAGETRIATKVQFDEKK